MYKGFSKIGNNFQRSFHRLTNGVGEAVFHGFVKIHGTNAAVGKLNGKIFYQSRNRLLTPEDDNFGFAVAMSALDWASKIEEGYIIFGEWAGKGVQKKVAISEVPKMFFPFIKYNIAEEKYEEISLRDNYHSLDGVDEIALTVPLLTITVDASTLNHYAQVIRDATLEVEKRCPVAFIFGASGVGEGIVFRPDVKTHGIKAYDSETWFKSKGGEHNNQGPKMPKVKVVDGVSESFLIPLIEARGVQGLQYLQEMNHRVDMSSTGKFIQWMIGDISDEVEIPEEVDMKICGTLSANWYKANHQAV